MVGTNNEENNQHLIHDCSKKVPKLLTSPKKYILGGRNVELMVDKIK